MKKPTYGPVYALGLYPKLARVFRKHGYALAIHGSLGRDFDLIAIPWRWGAHAPRTVMREVWKRFAIQPGYGKWQRGTKKPYGRVSFCCHLSFADCYLDVSFTPRLRVPRAKPVT